MTLGDKQRLFSRLRVKLETFWLAKGWEFTDGEGFIASPRRVWIDVPKPSGTGTGPSGGMQKLLRNDAEHMKGSLHYLKLAKDYNLFVDGKYIRRGSHPAYVELGTFWESLHPLCRWGGRFSDANHFSIAHAGKA